MSEFSRRGRPPHVSQYNDDFITTVKGQQFSFRKGEDGRLRRVGQRGGEAEDASYARTVVERHLTPKPQTDEVID